MRPSALAAKIKKLKVSGPITEAYQIQLRRAAIWNDEDVWYSSQKEHWLGWLNEYDGPGAYSRKIHKGRTAEYVFNHIVCPPMLLWLTEAAGIPAPTVRRAVKTAMNGSPTLMSHCAAIRRTIPWELVHCALEK